jgi:hypothetical protein
LSAFHRRSGLIVLQDLAWLVEGEGEGSERSLRSQVRRSALASLAVRSEEMRK